MDSDPFENVEHALQRTHVTQDGSGISPLSNLSADPPGILLIRSPAPFSPFPLENNGNDYEWIYQPPLGPSPSGVIPGLVPPQANLSQNPVSRSIPVQFVLFNTYRLRMVLFLNLKSFRSFILLPKPIKNSCHSYLSVP